MSEQAQVYIKQDNRIITVGQRWGNMRISRNMIIMIIERQVK